MAAILCNYAQYKGIPTESSGDLSGYSDADQVSAWAENAVIGAVDMDRLHGMSTDSYNQQSAGSHSRQFAGWFLNAKNDDVMIVVFLLLIVVDCNEKLLTKLNIAGILNASKYFDVR